ncbi:Thiol-specific monooxygenase [Pseudozyma hubeiensis]|nr:Thiol-specific monooxygenase [Pseudozyma hubeiensis]
MASSIRRATSSLLSMATTSTSTTAPRRIAIIGGGPSGLSSLSQLLSISPHFHVTLFERRSTHAGIWAYDADPGPCVIRYDRHGRAYPLWSGGKKDGAEEGRFRPPGAMYDGLRTNLPCDVMAYRSFPYKKSTALFPDRKTVEEYILEFGSETVGNAAAGKAEIRLNTAVSSVVRTYHDAAEAKDRIGWGSKWSLTSVDVNTGEKREETFDNIVIASGRCNTPSIPRVAGLHRFKGQILHSAWYRSPVPFKGITVLVVGNSSSGSDIARELVGYILRTLPEGQSETKKFIDGCEAGEQSGRVLHSYEDVDKAPPLDFDPRSEEAPHWARRISVVPRVSHVDEKGKIVFEGGEKREDVDVIVFGTGYSYDFPYLDQSLPPFDTHPLIPPAPSTAVESEISDPYTPPTRTSPYLTNLDDWSLFYAPDPSLCILGAPIRIVPMPLTHVQSRLVSAAWSLHLPRAPNSTALPRLDPSIPTTDPLKWSTTTSSPQDSGNKTSDLGYPSDTAYQNSLLSLLPAHLRPQGPDEFTPVTRENAPTTAEQEGWNSIAEFRNQRRADTKRLRRLLLGY